MNAIEWYDHIARRNGGYRSKAPYQVEGLSAEAVFEDELIPLVRGQVVLDAGCGHGAFTLEMARRAHHITGYDFSSEMVALAQAAVQASGFGNASFVHTSNNAPLPFADEAFDVIYSRRGPTNIIDKHHLLKPGGIITGIHVHPTPGLDITERIRATGAYTNITHRVFTQALLVFDTEQDLAEYLSSQHLSPDYTLPENRDAFRQVLAQSRIGDRIALRESRQIWRATKA